MALQAQYTATPKIDFDVVTTADTSFTQPTIANTATVFTAGANGSRIDNILMSAIGTTVAGAVRLFICKGFKGKNIVSITSSGTTCTVTTETAHGLIGSDTVTIQGCDPIEFNVKNATITVLTPTTFTYSFTLSSNVSANVVGYYSSTRVATSAKYSLLKETIFTAITPSTTVAAYNSQLSSILNPEMLPLILPAGFSLRATVSTTQTSSGIQITAVGGDF